MRDRVARARHRVLSDSRLVRYSVPSARRRACDRMLGRDRSVFRRSRTRTDRVARVECEIFS